jgi:hypothetical protein
VLARIVQESRPDTVRDSRKCVSVRNVKCPDSCDPRCKVPRTESVRHGGQVVSVVSAHGTDVVVPATQTRHPGTDLVLRYEVKPAADRATRSRTISEVLGLPETSSEVYCHRGPG